MLNQLKETIAQITASGKGILAADESTSTIKKRFDTIDLASTEDSRRDYREMLFNTPNLGNYISGAILFEETLEQNTSTGESMVDLLNRQGIIPGIKVDLGLINLVNSDNEKTTQGLDGLPERLSHYKSLGARFTKWRATYDITDIKPSMQAITTNATLLARYAAICQEQGIVPIVEPEVLMDGSHTIERCAEVTELVLTSVFTALRHHKVALEGIILKPNMVIAGTDCPTQATTQQVATMSIDVFKRTVPAAVPTINFLSGGQSEVQATVNLQAMNALGDLPWNLGYSYGRALQAPAIAAWGGKSENVSAGQSELLKRCKANTAATLGKYTAELENETTLNV
tara:strand:- start:7389 stop:8417 length:1029 start_codon:yes stop_codon:yes gene_type:complete